MSERRRERGHGAGRVPRMTSGRRLAAAALAAIALAAPGAPGAPVGPTPLIAQSPDQSADLAESRALTARAADAYRQGDYDAFRALLTRAVTLRPPHPALLYNLAAAYARTGAPDSALAILDRIADMGLAIDPGDDPDFAAIDPGTLRPVRDRLIGHRDPVGRADTAFTLGPPDFVPEGIAHDPDTGRFFIASIRHGTLLARAPDGTVREIAAETRPDRGSAMGMAVDPTRPRLWVGTAWLAQRIDVDSTDLDTAALLAVDLETGRVAAEYPVPGPGRHVLGDLTLAPDGTVFASDAASGAILRLDPGASTLLPLVAPGTLPSPQGLALVDGRLYVADYSLGLVAVDTASGDTRLVGQPASAALVGIDGLTAHGRDLVAVQNGFQPHRVLRIRLSDDGLRATRVQVLLAALPSFDEPTLATVVSDTLYLVANSHWNRFDGPTLDPDAPLTPPLILRLPLNPEP